MSAKPWHRRYHSDALSGMLSLTLEERGAYQTVLDLIYDRQGPVPDNERLLAGYMGCSIRKWRSLRERLIATGKLSVNEDGFLTNARAEKEIENDAKTTRKLAENGSKGGHNRPENAKKPNENRETDQAPLKPGSSLYQKPDTRGSDANASDGKPPPDPVKSMFDTGVRMLTESGSTEKQARSVVGAVRKHFAQEEGKALQLILAAGSKSDPRSYLMAAVNGKPPDDALFEQARRMGRAA